MPSPRKVAFGLAVLLCVGNLWTTFFRSGIPLGIEGRVDSLETRTEKHPGVDDVHLVGVGGRVLHLDKAFVQQLAVGDTLRKRPWSTSARVGGKTLKLGASRDFYGMVVAMLLLTGTAWLVTTRR